MQIVYHSNFLKSAKKLPETQQEKLSYLIETLQDNPYHPSLYTKHLAENLAGLLSFRITRDWRVIFQFFDQNTIQLLRVKHRKNIYR